MEYYFPKGIDPRIVRSKCDMCGELRDLLESGNICTMKPCDREDCFAKGLLEYQAKKPQIETKDDESRTTPDENAPEPPEYITIHKSFNYKKCENQ